MNTEQEKIPTAIDQTTRQKVLTAAISEFASNGFAGARVDRIAEQAGVNKAMIYYHFSSKEGLHSAVLEHLVMGMVSQLRQSADAAESLEDLLSRFAEVHISIFHRTPQMRQIILRELADGNPRSLKKLSDAISKAGLPQRIVEKFSKGQASGEIRNINIRQTFISWIAMNAGYFLMAPLLDPVWGITDREAFVTERRKAVIDLYLNGVKAR
jgi:TetR/AcrR family transcriptional regulator